MLSASGVTVDLGGRPILRDLGFEAAPGRLTAIVGPNGSGKTTLLRVLTGEIRGAGRVTLDGEEIARLAHWRLALRRAVLPQAARLAFPFTLREVVAMGLAAGASAGRHRVIDEALDAVDLAARGGARFATLSGGEQARGHLARALAQVWEPVADGKPAWLLLDEPVASLDIGHQLLVMRCVAAYARRGGGVVAVMHDLNLTAMFADRVVLLDGGGVAAAGTAAEVLTDALLGGAYRAPLRVNRAPPDGGVFVLPQAAL
ncbi:heme ABC transporter ATP-binding protein [Amaricoccus sp.]|uniref:heme ABC transporter ATP-binding protein n=1 Tax=Amaricoccus sp. TaxID=1872485 RepID=UPI002601885F|nr:heme ABC transporter ATP-binding protein [uncultured Amaricoccus sp.]